MPDFPLNHFQYENNRHKRSNVPFLEGVFLEVPPHILKSGYGRIGTRKQARLIGRESHVIHAPVVGS